MYAHLNPCADPESFVRGGPILTTISYIPINYILHSLRFWKVHYHSMPILIHARIKNFFFSGGPTLTTVFTNTGSNGGGKQVD